MEFDAQFLQWPVCRAFGQKFRLKFLVPTRISTEIERFVARETQTLKIRNSLTIS